MVPVPHAAQGDALQAGGAKKLRQVPCVQTWVALQPRPQLAPVAQ